MKKTVRNVQSHALSSPQLDRVDAVDVLRALGATEEDVDAHFRAIFANAHEEKKGRYNTDVHAIEYAGSAAATSSGSKRKRVANVLGMNKGNVKNALYAMALERDRVAAIRLKLVKAVVLLAGALEEFLETSSGTSLATVLGEAFSKFVVDLKKGSMGSLARLATSSGVIALFRPLVVSFLHRYVGSAFTRENLDRILFGREEFGMMVVRVLVSKNINSPKKTRTSIRPLIKTVLETMDFDTLYSASSRLYEYSLAYIEGRVESKGSFMCTLCSGSCCRHGGERVWNPARTARTARTASAAARTKYGSIFEKVVKALEAMAEAHGDRLSSAVHRAMIARLGAPSVAVASSVATASKVVPDVVVERLAKRFLVPAVEGRLGTSLDPEKFARFVREHRSRIRRLLLGNRPVVSLARMARDLGDSVLLVPDARSPVRNAMTAIFSSSKEHHKNNAFCSMCRRTCPPVGLATVLFHESPTRTLRRT